MSFEQQYIHDKHPRQVANENKTKRDQFYEFLDTSKDDFLLEVNRKHAELLNKIAKLWNTPLQKSISLEHKIGVLKGEVHGSLQDIARQYDDFVSNHLNSIRQKSAQESFEDNQTQIKEQSKKLSKVYAKHLDEIWVHKILPLIHANENIDPEFTELQVLKKDRKRNFKNLQPSCIY